MVQIDGIINYLNWLTILMFFISIVNTYNTLTNNFILINFSVNNFILLNLIFLIYLKIDNIIPNKYKLNLNKKTYYYLFSSIFFINSLFIISILSKINITLGILIFISSIVNLFYGFFLNKSNIINHIDSNTSIDTIVDENI